MAICALIAVSFLMTANANGQVKSVVKDSTTLAGEKAKAERGKLIFSDDFTRVESQGERDEVGNGWKTNSKNRAGGNKQADLKKGALYIYRHETADHGVSVTQPVEFQHGSVELRFMLENENDTLGLDFADPQCKTVHAGHLYKVTIGTKKTKLVDLKTGNMNLAIREARKAKTLTDHQKATLKTKAKSFENKLETGKWYSAIVSMLGDELTLSIDGKTVGSFSSAGIAHPTKRMLRIAVAKKAVVDDVNIFARTYRQPLKVLLVAGGCCHDYTMQSAILKEGIEAKINAKVTVVFNPEGKTRTEFAIYENDNWGDGYDVVIHDECSADVTRGDYVRRILAAHYKGLPAVNLHCAMHSYRWGEYRKPAVDGADNAGWFEMIGIQSTGHGPKAPIKVSYVKSDDPLLKGLEDWTTIDEELYNNIRMYGSSKVLAGGVQVQQPSQRKLKNNPDAKPVEAKAAVVWTNTYGPGKTKIFSTSLGHFNDTVKDDRYMELVVRGLLWSTGNLTEDGKPVAAFAK